MPKQCDGTTVVDMSQIKATLQDLSVHPDARARPDIVRMSRKELEDRFLCLYDESLLLKQHIHKQDDKIKKHNTKLLRLMKDRGRTEATGKVQGARNVEMEDMLEDLQEKVHELQTEKEGLKQRLLVAKHQLINPKSSRPRPYKHVQSRVNCGLKKCDISPSPAQMKTSLLEEARTKICNLENVIQSQRSHMDDMEAELQQQRQEMRKKEAEYEERLVQVQQIHKLRSNVHNNVLQIKLQKQLTDKSNTVSALEGQLQEHKQTLKEAINKLNELSEQLKHEKLKSRDLENRLQISNNKLELLPQQLSAVEQERNQLQESYNKLLDSIFDVSQQQKWQIQEQQLRLQVTQLEMALKADLDDKSELLQKLKAERETHEKLAEENKKLQVQCLEQKNEMEELKDHLELCCTECEPSKETNGLGDLSFLEQAEEMGGSRAKSCVQELRTAHAETVLELEKVRHLLCMESKLSNDYKVELEVVQQKMNSDRESYEQKLQRQTQLLHTSMAKIKKLQAHLTEINYSSKKHIFRQVVPEAVADDRFDGKIQLKPGKILIELQITCATLSPALLEDLGDTEPCTFCTYSFYLFKMHSTPVVVGNKPKYEYKSKYVVTMDDHFLTYLSRGSVTIDLHQALGMDWRTLASGQLQLEQLLKQDGKVHGTIQLDSADLGTVGSVNYWMRLTTESNHLIKDNLKGAGDGRSTLKAEAPPKLKYEMKTKDRLVAKESRVLIPQPTW